MPKQVSLEQSIMTGTIAAVAEASINHPLWAVKLRQQANKSFTLNPSILYRGFSIHVFSRIPTTSLQMAGSYYCQNNVFSRIDSPSTRSILSGLAGGAIAATFQTPVELTMTYQHKYGKNVLHQVNHIVTSQGIRALQTGYGGTAIRLGSYTCSFFSVQPWIKNNLEKKTQHAAYACSSCLICVSRDRIYSAFLSC